MQFQVEAAARRFSVKNMFLKISINSQGNTCTGVSFSLSFLRIKDQNVPFL